MSLTAVWSVRLANERNVKSRGPVLADGVVYQLFHYDKRDFFESRLMALALATGEELWHATVDHVANRPAIGADGTVFLSSFDGAVVAYDPNGDQIWRCDAIDSNIGPPTLAGSDRLVLAEIHGRARRTWCLNARTGAVLWTFDNGGHSYTLAATQDVVVHATVVSGANFGESTVRLFALSARDGSVRWSVTHTEYMFVPVIIDDTVIVGARGAVLGYDLASGKERARLALPEGTAAMHLLALPENSMAVADDATTLRHLELQRQKRFFRSNTKLVERWASPLSNPAVGGPVELGTSISILMENGRLEMFDARQGHRTGALDLRTGHHQSGGAARSGEFLAVAHGRTVCAYRY